MKVQRIKRVAYDIANELPSMKNGSRAPISKDCIHERDIIQTCALA